jgi:hypothetical protein
VGRQSNPLVELVVVPMICFNESSASYEAREALLGDRVPEAR